jgi:homoserine kinase
MMINDYKKVTVQVPASTANLGPGFDAIGLAIDYWNQATFELIDEGYQIEAEGESAAQVPKDENNYIIQSFFDLYRHLGEKIPPGLKVRCINQIPLASGMGSSTAALLTGLLGANALLGSPLDKFDLLNLATSIEGHPDNVSPALFGGLTIGTIKDDDTVLMHQYLIPIMPILIVIPEVELLTSESRAILPELIPRKDAIFNHSRTPFLIEALRSGNHSLLAEATRDRLHQPYRFPLISGSRQALDSAREAGALAATLSGAGPGLFVFPGQRRQEIAKAMLAAFEEAGVKARAFHLASSNRGANVSPLT